MLLLDDDAETLPENVLRAMDFTDHMFNLNEPTILHSLGERVNRYDFWWTGAVDDEFLMAPNIVGLDLSVHRIRETPVLNRRVDPDFNRWWMCLIPDEVVRKIGLSLPFFIKWDDAEYGLRAKEAGFPTVSLPGVAA